MMEEHLTESKTFRKLAKKYSFMSITAGLMNIFASISIGKRVSSAVGPIIGIIVALLFMMVIKFILSAMLGTCVGHELVEKYSQIERELEDIQNIKK